MGRYAYEDAYVVFGNPANGFWLHRLAPEGFTSALYTTSMFGTSNESTMCGKIVVAGLDDRVRHEDFPEATVCSDCEEIEAICDLLEQATASVPDRDLDEGQQREVSSLEMQALHLMRSATMRRRSGFLRAKKAGTL